MPVVKEASGRDLGPFQAVDGNVELVFTQADGLELYRGSARVFKAETIPGVSVVAGGTADDTAAVQAALTIGGRVSLQAGVIYTVSNLTVSSNTILSGYGATIKRKAGTTGSLFTGAVANLTVEGITFDNNLYANTSGNDAIFSLSNGSTDVTFADVVFTNLVANSTFECTLALYMLPGAAKNRRVRIRNMKCYGQAGSSNQNVLIIDEFYDVKLRDCFFFQVGGLKFETTSTGQGSGNARGLYVLGCVFEQINAGCCIVRPNGTSNIEVVHFIDNDGYQIGSAAIPKGLANIGEHVSAGAANLSRVVVTGNTVKDFWGDGLKVGGASGAVPETVVDGVTITGNSVDGSTAAGAFNAGAASDGISVTTATKVAITGNTVTQTGRAGIRVLGCQDGEITGNTVTSTVQETTLTSPTADSESGIALFASNTLVPVNLVISGNLVKNSGPSGSVATYPHIAGIGGLEGNPVTDRITITGNRCYDDRGANACQSYGVRFTKSNDIAANQPTNWTVRDNDLEGNATGQVLMFANAAGKGHFLALQGSGAPAEYGTLGSTWNRRNGGAGTSFYVKESGDALSTGWQAK